MRSPPFHHVEYPAPRRIVAPGLPSTAKRLCIDAPRDVHLQRIPAHEVVDGARANRDETAQHTHDLGDGPNERTRRVEGVDDGREPARR